jgi:hypothetical protein
MLTLDMESRATSLVCGVLVPGFASSAKVRVIIKSFLEGGKPVEL